MCIIFSMLSETLRIFHVGLTFWLLSFSFLHRTSKKCMSVSGADGLTQQEFGLLHPL